MTALLGITASNTILPSFVVLKGRKVSIEVQQLENANLYVTASPNAWITEEGFLEWIDRVWKPYSLQFERTLLIMDQFRVHKMAVVLEELRKCNTDVVYIPAGMTYFLQPCDVFLNKPFKGQIRTLWQKYMTDQYKTNTGKLISS